MSKFGSFLLFDGNCAEAMAFYRECFGGELTITKVSDTPMTAQFSPDKLNRVANAKLTSGIIEITATDWLHPTRTPHHGNMVGLYISEARYVELQTLF
jgi:PhnB protein